MPLLSRSVVAAFAKQYKVPLLVLVVVMLTSLVVAENKLAVVYGIVRILELGLFGLGAKVVLQKEGALALPKLGIVFGLGILLSTSIALSQFFKQGSIGGLLYFIGERSFSSETPGIANAVINGALLMRPYATFPHPNVLAWYLFIGTALCMTVLLLRRQYVLSAYVMALLILATISGSITIILTLSRSVVVAFIFFILLVPLIFFKRLHRRMLIGFYGGMLFLLAGLYLLTPLGARIQPLFHSDKAVVERSVLLGSAWSMIVERPISGVGLYNFLVRLPEYYPERHSIMQPVHNIYMLTLAEVGVIGFALLMYVVIRAGIAARAIRHTQLRAVTIYLLATTVLLGLIDHYMLTLEQGQILFVLLIASCFAWQDVGKSTNKKAKKV